MTAQAAASTSARDGIATSASTSSTKRRKNAPSKLPELDDSEEPSILVKLRPGKSGIRIDAVRSDIRSSGLPETDIGFCKSLEHPMTKYH